MERVVGCGPVTRGPNATDDSPACEPLFDLVAQPLQLFDFLLQLPLMLLLLVGVGGRRNPFPNCLQQPWGVSRVCTGAPIVSCKLTLHTEKSLFFFTLKKRSSLQRQRPSLAPGGKYKNTHKCITQWGGLNDALDRQSERKERKKKINRRK